MVNAVDAFLKVLDFEASNFDGKPVQVDDAQLADVTQRSALPVSRAMSKDCAGVPIEMLAE